MANALADAVGKAASCVWTYTVGPAGLHYIGCPEGPEAPLFVRDPATDRERLLEKVERPRTR